MKSNILVISCSLHRESNSRTLANRVLEQLKKSDSSCELLDLRQLKLPLCDGDQCYLKPEVQGVATKISQASGIILASPVYNYDLNAAAKNMVELTGKAWESKVVGFLLAAGGVSSYMSAVSFMNSLILDFRCWIVPRFVYSTEKDFSGDTLTNPQVVQRLNEFVREFIRVDQVLGV